MLKRTKGRILLTLLVTTGLAGTLNNSTLSQKERKQAINLIKTSRNEVLGSINGLSPKQMNYKHSAGEPSINELVTTMVLLEKNCSDEIKQAMEKPANSENRLKIALTDAQLTNINNYELCKPAANCEHSAASKDPSEALKKFLILRNNHIKYIRTSTEDLRNHVVTTSAGWIDCYQYYLLLADRSSYFAEKINQIKALPSFPTN
jgi:hypothetical protein